MIQLERDTIVTFPSGQLVGNSEVLAAVEIDRLAGRYALVTAETPFHPIDHRWPDQPADTGTVDLLGQRMPVEDCVVGAAKRGESAVLIGQSIPARRGDDGWCWLVLHVVDLTPDIAREALGATVRLTVNKQRRVLLSGAHTACHLSGLAVNAALSDLWRKSVSRDSLGSPDFEKYALVASCLTEGTYRDTYRIGRTLRKAGFDSDGLVRATSSLADDLSSRILAWVETAASVRVVADGPGLGDLRTWTCELPHRTARVPCGGTHLTDLAALAAVRVEVDLSAGCDVLEMFGEVDLRPTGEHAATAAQYCVGRRTVA